MELVKRTGGRPPVTFSQEQITQYEALAGVLTKAQLADYFAITEKTLRAVEERQPEVSAAYKQGRSKAVGDVGSALYQKAINGNVQACMFFLRTQGGWSEKTPVVADVTQEDRTWKIEVVRATGHRKEDGGWQYEV